MRLLNNKLSQKFKKWYEEIRILRNRFMHTVDKTSDIKPEIVFKSIVLTHQELNLQNPNWFQKRLKYLGVGDNKVLSAEEVGDLTLRVQSELFFVVNVCSMEVVNELFKYDKNKDGSHCVRCLETMNYNEFFDKEWLKYCLGTVQMNKRTKKRKCIFCDSEQNQ